MFYRQYVNSFYALFGKPLSLAAHLLRTRAAPCANILASCLSITFRHHPATKVRIIRDSPLELSRVKKGEKWGAELRADAQEPIESAADQGERA